MWKPRSGSERGGRAPSVRNGIAVSRRQSPRRAAHASQPVRQGNDRASPYDSATREGLVGERDLGRGSSTSTKPHRHRQPILAVQPTEHRAARAHHGREPRPQGTWTTRFNMTGTWSRLTSHAAPHRRRPSPRPRVVVEAREQFPLTSARRTPQAPCTAKPGPSSARDPGPPPVRGHADSVASNAGR